MSYISPEDFTEYEPSEQLAVASTETALYFQDFEGLKSQCEDLAAYLKSLEVSEDSEQEIKKIVANARKLETAINQRKKDIKQSVMEPYLVLEGQAKELILIIQDGENIARDKLADIEHERKGRKMEEISRIWDLRKDHWVSGQYLDLADFMEERYLNKTTSINAVEKEMVGFFQKTSTDIDVIRSMPDVTDLLVEYKKTLSFTRAVANVNERKEALKKVEQPEEPYMVIRITGKADCILAKQLLKDINYKIVKENA